MNHISGQDLSDCWTPKEVGAQLVEALRWARFAAGRTGPAGMKAAFHGFLPSLDDFLDEGWGNKETAETEERTPQRRYSPAKVSAMTRTLDWPGRYLVSNGMDTSAEMLHLWVRCKVYKTNFDKAVDARRPALSRASAYRYRDRALSAIAQGLTKDGEPKK